MVASDPASNTNLLLGLVALQSQLISRPDLIAAVRHWVQGRSRTLGQIMLERAAVQPDELAALETLVSRLLERHGGDIDQALAGVQCLRSVRIALQGVADAELHSCLARVSSRQPASNQADPAAAEVATVEATPPGQRFRLGRLLAEGNLGSLYLARDEELDREVIIKQIHAGLAGDTEAQARFSREIRYASELEHSGIVPIYGAGQYSDGRRYYAMRYIKGENLRSAIDRCHLQERSARLQQVRSLLPRFVAVCQAISYAHERGVLHRDIKPENIMLSVDGETIVVDWGLAKSVGCGSTTDAPAGTLASRAQQDHNPTQQFQAIGTLAYMSPETAGGELDRVGPRSDVFSLGATLYHLLTGKPPFSRSGASSGPLLSQVQKGEFPSPRAVWSEVPPPLEAVCLKAMALAPEQRYRSARALAEDVNRWITGELNMPTLAPWTSRVARRMQRHPLVVAAFTAVAAVLLTAAAFIGLDALRPPSADREPEVQTLTAELAAHRARLDEKTEEAAQAAAAVVTVRGERDAARRLIEAAQQAEKIAKSEVNKWKGEYQQADRYGKELQKDMEAQVARHGTDLAKSRAQEQRVERQLDSFLGGARHRFDKSREAVEGTFGAFKTRLDDPKSKQAKIDQRWSGAQTQRTLGDMYVLLEQPDEAESEYENAIGTFDDLAKADRSKELRLELAYTWHNYAWLIASSASATKPKVELAVRRAKLAVDAKPRSTFQLTYGMALYRNRDWNAARKELGLAREPLRKDGDPADYDICLLGLAMANHQLGDAKAAMMYFDEAQTRLQKADRSISRELDRFRLEAERVLAEVRNTP